MHVLGTKARFSGGTASALTAEPPLHFLIFSINLLPSGSYSKSICLFISVGPVCGLLVCRGQRITLRNPFSFPHVDLGDQAMAASIEPGDYDTLPPQPAKFFLRQDFSVSPWLSLCPLNPKC